jgi:hypothetical protein
MNRSGPDARSPFARVRVRIEMVLLVGVFAAGAWLVLDDRAAKIERAATEQTQAAKREAGPELVGRGPSHSVPSRPEMATPERGREATWRIEGRVLRDGGASVPGAEVVAVLRGRGPSRLVGRSTSGADGAYSFDLSPLRERLALSIGELTLSLQASADGHWPVRKDYEGWRLLLLPPAGSPLRYDFTLSQGQILRGRVVRPDGEPVGDARLQCCDGTWLAGRTDSLPDGRFVIGPTSRDGAWEIVAAHPDHGVGRAAIPAAGEPRDLPDIVLHATPTIEGHVVFPDGTRVAEAVVESNTDMPSETCLSGLWPTSRTTTRPDGSFRLLLPAPGRCRLFVDDEENGHECSTADRDVLLVVHKRRVRVSLVDPDGHALPDVDLMATRWEPREAGRLDEMIQGRLDYRTALQVGEADYRAGWNVRADGRVDVWTEPGTAWLFSTQTWSAATAEAWVVTSAERWQEDVRLVVRPLELGPRLGVHLVGPDGELVPFFDLVVTTLMGSHLRMRTVQSGEPLGPLPTGTVRYELSSPRGEAAWDGPLEWLLPARGVADLRAGETTRIEVHGAWGGRLRVTLRSAEDTTADRLFSIRAIGPSGPRTLLLGEEVPSDGRRASSSFRPGRTAEVTPLLVPGAYVLEVTEDGLGRGEPIGRADATVRPHTFTDVSIDLAAPR